MHLLTLSSGEDIDSVWRSAPLMLQSPVGLMLGWAIRLTTSGGIIAQDEGSKRGAEMLDRKTRSKFILSARPQNPKTQNLLRFS